ncbi:probable WRKY transcription factor 23 [Cucurbita maxima]|uniref:Probable WRKY transcription factor 23 n=1 Tax=Cucurbita maxima TaxID=3661 RepID=A0A6J1JVC0_CUCMA|nr:probable WRKY transcription factor 23 [Cucurbita maxima]
MEEVAAADSLRFPFPEHKGYLGFMEMLDVDQEFLSQFDVFSTSSLSSSLISNPIENLEIWNQWPTTPNYSSSISSTSSEIVNDEVIEPKLEREKKQHSRQTLKTDKQSKTRKTSRKKKDQEPRFAFMTKSEVDHLEDGYRWRKYGQKAVKNSPYPRSYYRCTNVACNVKKRVERYLKDSSIVVTTYEGQHTHSSPNNMARTTFFPPPISTALYNGSAMFTTATTTPSLFHYQNGHNSNFINHPKSFVASSFHPPCDVASSNHANQFFAATINHRLFQDIAPFQYNELAWRDCSISQNPT